MTLITESRCGGECDSLKSWWMNQEQGYTPGYSGNAVSFMLRRSLRTHGQFFTALLEPGLSVLDCGCGPGSISADIAGVVRPAKVVGVDFSDAQVETASTAWQGVENVSFRAASVYSLPFAEGCFDRVFSHALLEHLTDPLSAVRELARVLKTGGYMGLCSPYWPAFVLTPGSADVARVIDQYSQIQRDNGGDPGCGGRLGEYANSAGLKDVKVTARFECYEPVTLISEYLAQRLDLAGESVSAAVLRDWSLRPGVMFAQAWISVTARKGQAPLCIRDQNGA